VIVTFYSFKGGVGRSMALANVARWFQLCGLNVAVVDWDLEAPGLETFFFTDEAEAAQSRAQLGVIDLLHLYQRMHANLGLDQPGSSDDAGNAPVAAATLLARLQERLPPMQHALVHIAPPRFGAPAGIEPGRLRLLGAGWREGERFAAYANAVQAFDWDDFYAGFHGQAYFEWLRGALAEVADIVLVDSRTGVTEMGGVCTRQLADVVVALVAPNRQNIDGSSRMAASFTRAEVLAERGGRALEIVMVPSRVDVASEIKLAFESDFEARADPFLHADFRQMGRRFWDLRIPYIAKYAFMERLAIGEPDGDPDMAAAYKAIAAHVAWLAPEGSRVQTLMRPEFDRIFGEVQTRIFIAGDRVLARALALLTDSEQRLARRVLDRLVTVAPPDTGGHDVPRQWPVDAFDEAHRQVIAKLVASGVVRHAEGKRQLVALCNDDFIERGELRRWIDEDRAFLLWRQNLRTYVDDWLASNREDAALLQGTALDTALRTRRHVAADQLDADEHEFIERSEAAMRVAAQAARPAGPVLAHPAGTATPRAAARAPAALAALALLLVLALGLGVWWVQRPAHRLPDAVGTAPPAPTQAAPALDVAQLVTLGKAQLANGDIAAAQQSFATALRVDANSRDALLGRARAYRSGGNDTAALADLDALLQRGPNDTEALVERAGILAERGDTKAALAAYGDAIKASAGKSTEALFARGSLHERLGDRRAAAADFNAVLVQPGDELTRTAAAARLARLDPRATTAAPVASSGHSAVVQVSDLADLKTAEMVAQALVKGGYRVVVSPSLAKSGAAAGFVYFYAEQDAAAADRLRSTAQEALAQAGYRVRLRTQQPDEIASGARRLELVLPPLANPRPAKAAAK
jgi:tetratricopeptide (TPR) repeat protein